METQIATTRGRGIGKGPQRRQAIAEAGAAVLRKSGIEGLTHRAVAEQARVPLGSTTYYFKSREDLLLASVECVAETSARWMRGWAAENAGRDIHDALPEMVFDYLVKDRAAAILDVELFVLAARRPDLRECVLHWSEQFTDVLTQFVGRETAEHLAATVNGYSLVNVVSEPPTSVDEVRRVITPALERAAG